jgi:integrase
MYGRDTNTRSQPAADKQGVRRIVPEWSANGQARSGGKAGRVRTVPVPSWVKNAVDAWTDAAGISGGRLFRAIGKNEAVWGEGVTQNVVWYLVKGNANRVGVKPIAPHDLRSYAECRIMPSRFQDLHLARSLGGCGPTRFGMIGEGYRPFRKASSHDPDGTACF